MTVYVIDSYENIPYGEHNGIVKVFSQEVLANEWVKLQTTEYSYHVEKFIVDGVA